MPDKRNVSKQRRQARNRATRDALAARTEHAQAAPIASSTAKDTSSESASTGSSAKATAGGSGATPARGGARQRPVMVAYEPPPPGLKGVLTSSRIGDKAVLAAFLLAVVAAVLGLFVTNIAVDDRGETVPNQFGGLTIAVREEVTGQPVGDQSANILDAYGGVALMLVGTPVLITAFALWSNRRPDRARVLTFSLMALVAATILFPSTMFAFAPVIALGLATFRVRKADLVAPAAPPARGGAREAGDTADAPARPASFLERLLGGGAAGAGSSRAADQDPADDETADEADDPLAELEAEIAAESGDEPDDAASGSARKKG